MAHQLNAQQKQLLSFLNSKTKSSFYSFLPFITSPYSFYIYGPVGTGKTTTIKVFFDSYEKKKIYFHHDEFINFLLNSLQTQSLEIIIKNLSVYKLLWIDEIQGREITEMVLLTRTLKDLSRKVSIILSGNVSLINLFPARVIYPEVDDAFHFIEKNFYLLELLGKDYRRLNKNEPHYFLTPHQNEMWQLFLKIIVIPSHSYTLNFKGRSWDLKYCSGSHVWLDFNLIHTENRTFVDFSELLKHFNIFFIDSIPIFTDSNLDACRRFVTLIDCLYQADAEVYCCASTLPDNLYQSSLNSIPFERCASRLIELCGLQKL